MKCSLWLEETRQCCCLQGHLLCSVYAREHSGWLWHAGMVHPATLCWICAGAVDKAVEYWGHEAEGPAFSEDMLQVRHAWDIYTYTDIYCKFLGTCITRTKKIFPVAQRAVAFS